MERMGIKKEFYSVSEYYEEKLSQVKHYYLTLEERMKPKFILLKIVLLILLLALELIYQYLNLILLDLELTIKHINMI